MHLVNIIAVCVLFRAMDDLIDYYIALEYILGAVDNVFSIEQNHDFGVDLIFKYASIGKGSADLDSAARPGIRQTWNPSSRNCLP